MDAVSIDTSVAVYDFASKTVASSASALRPLSSAIVLMKAAVSSVTLELIVSGRSSPPGPTGDAAPILVTGAMAAMCAAAVTNVPAEAA